MLYITSPYKGGDVFLRITSSDGVVETFTLPQSGSFSYNIGNFASSKLVITEGSLGKNHQDKGYKVEGFKDASFTDPASIFSELRVLAGSDNGSSRQQANSSFLKGEFAPGKIFRLGHGITDIFSSHRRVFATFMAVEEGTTNVTISNLPDPGEILVGPDGDYDLGEEKDGTYSFSFTENQSHAIAINNTPGSPLENADALVGALVNSDKNIVVNVGYWGGANAWGGSTGRDIGFDQIKPFSNVSNEYIFIPAAGEHAVGGSVENTNEYVILVAHENNTKIWMHTKKSDTSTVDPKYTLDAGEYKILYFEDFQNQMYVLSNKRVYGYQNMAGDKSGPQASSMMLISGINPLASNKIDGIYNIEDIAGINFTMEIKILTKTNPDLKLNGISYTTMDPTTEVINGREDFSFFQFKEADVNTILSVNSGKRLTIESDGPVYGLYYGFNSVQGIAGYFFSFSDFDRDGISDSDDKDDDNDGILDIWETDVDTDGDGLINRFDLDSDNDGCLDAVEAGYTDQDDNGILGFGSTDSVIVDDDGIVIANSDESTVIDGYTLPNDRDNNDVPDFREVGKQIQIIKHPEDIVIVESCPEYIEKSPYFAVETNGGYVTYKWQISNDDGLSWGKILDTETFTGFNTDTLKIINSTSSISGSLFRVIIEARGYVCGVPDTSNVAKVTVLPDNDSDCITDSEDLDDDNDGIYDIEEDTVDIDNDGIPNHFDLDSDGDDCFDVLEAGFSDPDDDGILGESPVTVDSLGRVIGVSDGYTDPLDGDNNGVDDYNEVGSSAVIITQPLSKLTSPFGEVMFFVNASSLSPMIYDWQVSMDFGASWQNLENDTTYTGVNNDTLYLKNLSLDMDSYRYRIVISTPSFTCDEDLISNWVFLLVRPDNDMDGVFDIYDVDDDNDGIYDTLELSCETNKFIEDFGQGDYTSTEYTNYTYAGSGVVSDGSYTIGKRSTNWFNNWLEFNDHTGNENGRMFICNAQYEPGKYFYKRRIDNLATNVPYEVSFWLKDLIREFHVNTGLPNTHIPPNITFQVYSVNEESNQEDLLYQYNTGNVPRDENWHEYRFNFNNLDNSSIEIVLLSNQSGGYGNDFAMDDIEFNAGCYDDIDGDGIINSFDLDTDGDGCSDVNEAGYLDADMDSVLGDSPVDVDIYGRVIGEYYGYVLPNDLDENGSYDYKEYGVSPTIIFNPQSDSAIEEKNISYTINATPLSLLEYQWQESKDNGLLWSDLMDTLVYSGVKTKTLTISNLSLDMRGYLYRVMVFVPSFACSDTLFSEPAYLTVLEDNDKDGVSDLDDVDDDNDGIYDIEEDTIDIDSDGIPNHFDLDSDGDGCSDVLEAGYTDDNLDGILGDDPVSVDSIGRVISGVDGYTDPLDADINGIKDYKELGDDPIILLQPISVEVVVYSSTLFFVSANASGNLTYLWQINDGSGWSYIADNDMFMGINNDTLLVDSVTQIMDGYSFRVIIKNSNLICSQEIISDEALLLVLPDNDRDKIPDIDDLDDDNDGILDLDEGSEDIDNDGIPNYFDLDSDGDGCSDVIEAGFIDDDNDEILCLSPVLVDSLGKVICSSGYIDALDRDNNSIYDYKEKGSSLAIINNPSSVSIIETRNAKYTVQAIADGTILYQWQASDDEGVSWVDIQDDNVYLGTLTASLTLTNAPLEFNDYQFRVNISTPAFVCDDDLRSQVVLTVLPDNDKDGIADEDDLDDDNDGILDIYEGSGDLDNDGIINIFDLDSDGDGCYDVIESGCYDDDDDDGIVGNSPVEVDGLGLVVNENLIARYNFSGNAIDSSSNLLNGVVDGALLVNDRYGIPSSAYMFDGIDDKITINNDSLLNLGMYERFSISLWTKFDDNYADNLNKIFIHKSEGYESINKWLYLYSSPTNKDGVSFNSEPGSSWNTVENFVPNLNQWYHMVIQKDGYIYTHYIDGDTVSSVVDSTQIFINTAQMIIGGQEMGGPGEWFHGIIDDIVISANYTCNDEPFDLDDSGVYDFLETGGKVKIDTISGTMIVPEMTSTSYTVESTSISKTIYQWQFSSDGGSSWKDIIDSIHYSGTNTKTLQILNAPLSYSGYLFRLILSTPSFICGIDKITNNLLLTVLPDNDKDGIADEDDLDDDNDGIYDLEEGSDDLDEDGIPNYFDLDSDGDNCFDVIEAGYTDDDTDGILGSNPVIVDSLGKVISGVDGYTIPIDRDGSLVSDYLEYGSSARILIEPYDIAIVERSDTIIKVIADVDSGSTKVYYLWQVSDNGGISWEGLSSESNTLTIENAEKSYNDRLFRVIVSTPSYICGLDIISDVFRILVMDDYDIDFIGDYDDVDDDNDGIYDSLECINNASLILKGDVDSTYLSGYPIIASFIGNSDSSALNSETVKNKVNILMDLSSSDIYEYCYIISDVRFDNGLEVLVNNKKILSFNKSHWDINIGLANSDITNAFNGDGIFVNTLDSIWTPWSEKYYVQLVIRSGSIKLLSRTKDNNMIDVIPYMDNTVDGWYLDKNFSFSCEEGLNLEIGNTTYNEASIFYSENKVMAYVCSDTDLDGELNNKDLDSDDDDCYDVNEAGFIDSDNDGVLDKSPVGVDLFGRVISSDNGYLIPLDNDNNSVMDFLEEGFEINIISEPDMYYLIKEGDTFNLFVDIDLANRFVYQWQKSDIYGSNWIDLSDTLIDNTIYSGSNTNTLNIYGIVLNDNQIENLEVLYRLIISSPSYYCEDDIFTQPYEVEVFHRDLHIPSGFSPNADGINDYWRIRGIEGYPNNKVKIFNIWGTRVYEKKGYRNEWDGKNQVWFYYGDGMLPESTYYYMINLGDGSKPLKGFVYIKRE